MTGRQTRAAGGARALPVAFFVKAAAATVETAAPGAPDGSGRGWSRVLHLPPALDPMTPCQRLIAERIGQAGPITVAEFMRIALYDPAVGYYAVAAQRSGRAGDFYTSVDTGPDFGSMLGRQFEQMWRLLGKRAAPFDLVEVGAGNGRLSADVLAWAAVAAPQFHASLRVTLVESSSAARARHAETLGPHATSLASSTPDLPDAVNGIVYANELLDAMPVHLVEVTAGGLCEIYVDVEGERLIERFGPLSTPELATYLAGAGVRLEPGWRAEVNLDATRWIAAAGRGLRRGFLVLIDYGHEAAALYSSVHPRGTLRAFTRHVLAPSNGPARPAWLDDPGGRDLTSDVDFTSVRAAAVAAGLEPLGTVDQASFLLDLGLLDRMAESCGDALADIRRRMALKALVLPQGPGGSHSVLAFGRGAGRPALAGFSRCVDGPKRVK